MESDVMNDTGSKSTGQPARLRSIADASRRENGIDIPLGSELRKAADEIERLRLRIKQLSEDGNTCYADDLGLDKCDAGYCECRKKDAIHG